jgi:Universal stress protein family
MKIMVTLDGSSFAEAVVGPAAQLAREAKLAEVYLVRVVDPSEELMVSGHQLCTDMLQEDYGIQETPKERLYR